MAYLKNLKEMLKLNIRMALKDKDNKEEIIDEIINDLMVQTKRLEFMVDKAEKSEESAQNSYSENKEESLNLENSARSALLKNDEQLAKKALSKKLEKDMSLKEKEIIYMTLNAQASQLKEQLETLNYKLNEAIKIKSSLASGYELKDVLYPMNEEMYQKMQSNSINENVKASEGEKNSAVIDAEIERLMQEIKETHNIK